MKHAEKNRFARTGVCRNVCMGLRLGALAVSLALCGLLAGCGGNGADPAEKAIVDDVAAGVEAYDSVLSALGVDPQTGVVEGGGEVSEGLRHPVQTDLTPVTLERVVDGDTIVVEMNGTRERVRLIGINTPESVAPEQERNTEEGKDASSFLEANVEAGDCLWLMFDTDVTDRYDRLLAYVWTAVPDDFTDPDEVAAKMLNGFMASEGYAVVHAYKPNDAYCDILHDLADDAEAAGRGLWADGSDWAEGI